MMRIALRALGVGILAAVVFASSAQADPAGPEFDWRGTGGCEVPVVGMTTNWSNVMPYIPPAHRSRVVVVGSGDTAQAGLLFVFIRCPHSELDTDRPDRSRDNVVQVLTGVLYNSLGLDDVQNAQFYLLSSAINWSSFASAEVDLGSPTDHVSDASLTVSRDELSGLGAFEASVPGGRAPFRASGRILAPNPVRDFPQDAKHFFDGPYGGINVLHDESWAPGNAATATITAEPGSFVAQIMGATSRDAQGLYVWIHDSQHVHEYRIGS